MLLRVRTGKRAGETPNLTQICAPACLVEINSSSFQRNEVFFKGFEPDMAAAVIAPRATGGIIYDKQP